MGSKSKQSFNRFGMQKRKSAPNQQQRKTTPNQQQDGSPVNKRKYTTVMLRNIPNKYTRDMLAEEIDNQGFQGKYGFLFLPNDFRNRANLGYAFLDFNSNNIRKNFVKKFN